MRRWALTGLVCLVAQLAPARARAQPAEPVDFEWNAPSGCPQLEEVEAGIRKLAGPRKSSSVPLHAEATVTRAEDGELHLRLVLHAGDMVEERNIDGRSCSALAGATAVAIALLFRSGALHSDDSAALGSAANGDPSDSAPATPATAAPPTKQPEPAHAEHPAEPPSQRRWRALVQLPLGVLSVGPLPAPTLGVAAGAGLAIDQWRFLAKGAYWFPKQAEVTSDFRQYAADLRLVSATLQVCRALTQGTLELAPCASVSALHLSARGQGAHIAAHEAQATWIAAGVGADARLHVASWLSLLVGVAGELETSRPRLSLGGVGPVATLWPAAGVLTAGAEWIF